MKKYFYLQLKLSSKLLPFVLGVTLALLVGLGVILSGLLANFQSSEEDKEFVVALAGDTDNTYIFSAKHTKIPPDGTQLEDQWFYPV